MLELNSASFYAVTAALQTLRHMIDSRRMKSVEEGADGGLVITLENDPVLTKHLKDDAEELEGNLRTLGVTLTLMSATKLLETISAPRGFTWESIGKAWDEIHFRLLDELKLTKVLVLQAKDQAYFEPTDPLFGEDFASKFPTEGAFELDEAAKCLALGRPTASVFHLMHLMEIGIRAIARCLQIPDPVKPAERNWSIILKAIKDGMEARWPAAADRMAPDPMLFELLHASLHAVRNPWRNATMHGESKYTDDEAEHILMAVRGFMKKLASRCDEEGNPKA